MPPHHTVMDRLVSSEITISADRALVDAIRAWEDDPQDTGLLDYTGLDSTELAALVVGECSVRELLAARVLRAASAA